MWYHLLISSFLHVMLKTREMIMRLLLIIIFWYWSVFFTFYAECQHIKSNLANYWRLCFNISRGAISIFVFTDVGMGPRLRYLPYNFYLTRANVMCNRSLSNIINIFTVIIINYYEKKIYLIVSLYQDYIYLLHIVKHIFDIDIL